MAEPHIPAALGPDFYIAAIGRSGSTMLGNWLSSPPERIVFNEPFFLRTGNSRLLRIQLETLGLAVPDSEWKDDGASALDRFVRIMGPRLEGRRWAAKEVLCEEHRAMTRMFEPPRVLLSVRNIVDVALSFFEKHRLQNNLDRFSDDWVVDHCRRESAGLVDYLDFLNARSIPALVVRYEEFTSSEEFRGQVAEFTGWPGGGDAGTNLVDYGRGFEVDRHGRQVSASTVDSVQRRLGDELLGLARSIGEQCAEYQRRFGYS